MEGISLAPATTNPGTGETYENSVYWINGVTNQPQIGNSTIITNAKLPDGTFPYQFLYWGDGTNKWEVSAPGATLQAQTIPISGKSSAEFTSNGTLGLIGGDLTRLGNVVGGSLLRSCIDINPSTINIISQKPGGGPGTVQVNGTPGTTGQALGITPSAGFGWITPADLVPGIYSNSHYVNADSATDTLDAALIAIGASQGQVIYFSAGSYSGSYTVSGKNLMGWIGPPVADTRTICEFTSSVTFDNTCQRIRLSNLQISGPLTLQQTGNNYYGGIIKGSGGVIISGSGSHFFTDCEFAVPVSIDAGFSGIVTFFNCNFTGGNLFPLQASPLQVGLSNCIGLASRSANATYVGFNLNADSTSTQTATDTQTGFITLASGRGTTGQALVSGGALSPPVWSTISGGGGGGGVTEVTANAPLSVVNGTTTPDISLDVSSITSTLLKEVVCLDGTIDVSTLPGVDGKTAQVSLANVGTSGLYTNVANITTNTKGQVTSVTSYAPDQPVLSLSVGTGLQNVGTAQNPFINNTGVVSITSGTGITVAGPTQSPTISNSGVISVTAGGGISNVGTAQNPNLINDGVLSFTAGTGLVNVGTAQNPNVNNDGVLELTAGTNITITGSKSNYTINASGGGGTVAGSTYISTTTSGGTTNISSINTIVNDLSVIGIHNNTATTNKGTANIIFGNATDFGTYPQVKTYNLQPGGQTNTVIGVGAMPTLSTTVTAPTSNTSIGFLAGAYPRNTVTGDIALTRNVCVGQQAMGNITASAADNAAFGFLAGFQSEGGNNNVYLGTRAGSFSIGTYGGSVNIGREAGVAGNGGGNVAVGYLCSRSVGGFENTSIGFDNSLLNSGNDNVYIGNRTAHRIIGDRNIIIGSGVQQNAANETFSNRLQIGSPDNLDFIVGDMLGNTLTMDGLAILGDVELTNATLDPTAGGSAGTHLRIRLNGTYYKIALLQD